MAYCWNILEELVVRRPARSHAFSTIYSTTMQLPAGDLQPIRPPTTVKEPAIQPAHAIYGGPPHTEPINVSYVVVAFVTETNAQSLLPTVSSSGDYNRKPNRLRTSQPQLGPPPCADQWRLVLAIQRRPAPIARKLLPIMDYRYLEDSARETLCRTERQHCETVGMLPSSDNSYPSLHGQ